MYIFTHSVMCSFTRLLWMLEEESHNTSNGPLISSILVPSFAATKIICIARAVVIIMYVFCMNIFCCV